MATKRSLDVVILELLKTPPAWRLVNTIQGEDSKEKQDAVIKYICIAIKERLVAAKEK